MQYPSDSALWRLNFVGTLQLLGQAAARQPFGIPDPVLCGASAVELYTGGLWPAGCLQVFATDARPLIVELFADGFRWTRRPRHVGRGLWHPGLQIGIDVINDDPLWGLAEQANMLTVAIDLGITGPADKELVSLKVVGIEDLIVEEAAGRRSGGVPSGEATARAGVLAGLGREGVGGRLRGGYLHRRLAWETHGEVTFDALSADRAGDDAAAPRIISLTRMRTLISAWRVRNGYSFDRPRLGLPRGRRETLMCKMPYRNDSWERAGDPCVVAANVIPLDASRPRLPE